MHVDLLPTPYTSSARTAINQKIVSPTTRLRWSTWIKSGEPRRGLDHALPIYLKAMVYMYVPIKLSSITVLLFISKGNKKCFKTGYFLITGF